MSTPETKYWTLQLMYGLPENPDLRPPALALEADALNARTMVLQTCTNPDTRVTCENDAEIAFREQISSIPGTKFVLGYFDSNGTQQGTLDLTSEEAVDPNLNGTYPFNHPFNHLEPNTWAQLAVKLREQTTASGTAYNLVDPDSDFLLPDTRGLYVAFRVLISATEGVEPSELLTSLLFCFGLTKFGPRVADSLAELGIGPNYEDAPVSLCVPTRNYAFAKYMLEHGAIVDAYDTSGTQTPQTTPLLMLMGGLAWGPLSDAEIELAKTLLEHGADVNATDVQGTTPLLALMGMGLNTDLTSPRIVELTEMLIDHGADVNAKDSVVGWTPLIRLMYSQLDLTKSPLFSKDPQLALAKVLLDHKADINAQANVGEPFGMQTALSLAEKKGLTDCAKLLRDQPNQPPPA